VSFYEDIRAGETYALGHHVFAAAEIKAFATRYDPQSFHVDEQAARRSQYGALIASGWHTASVWMRLMVTHRRRMAEAARARGTAVGVVGPALGFRDLKWLKPVYADDIIDYAAEVVEMRASDSHPGFGLMSIRATGVNQNGDLVISFVSTSFVARRSEP
jgi:acyl dehydratase